MDSIVREFKFALRDRVVLFSLIAMTLLSSYSLIIGLSESASEKTMIERTKKLVDEDRNYNLKKQSDAGGAAYYAFHFTYDIPSSLAFTSRGIRDDLPWKHRIRMLALEGQIYETDAGNPELSKVGKLDFAFVAAFLLPLLSILLLYDLRAAEIRNNRWAFLSATSGNGNRLVFLRAILRTALLYASLIVPLIIASSVNGADVTGTFMIMVIVALNALFWCLLSIFIIARIESGPTNAAVLLGCWFVIAVAIPVGSKYIIEKSITVPKGGEILLTQREAVNDAWDLPKEATMVPFLERHPQWANSPKVRRPFEWKWYYAFQQVGDQTAEPLSKALKLGVTNRDKAMSFAALLSPTLLTDRVISKTAKTDVLSFQQYDNCVRNFHHELRKFYYPMMFGDITFSEQTMANLPTYKSCSEINE